MTATYNPVTLTIEVSGTVNTIDSIYTDINNPAVLSKIFDSISNITTYNLTANINVQYGAVLNIEGPTLPLDEITSILAFNEPSDGYYRIRVYGDLYIKNFGITTSTNYVWNIRTLYTKYVPNFAGRLFLDNVDITKCGRLVGTEIIAGIKLGYYNDETIVVPITWTKVKVHDLFDYSTYPLDIGLGPYDVIIDNSEFYNIQGGWRLFEFSRADIINSKFHDIDIPYSGGTLMIQWGGHGVSNCEIYNINAPNNAYIWFTKEGIGPSHFIKNYVHDCNVISIVGIYASNIVNKIIIKDNIVDRCTVTDTTAWWFANQYLGGVSILSEFSNNKFTNITGHGFYYHSGGRNAIIKDNILQCTGTSFRANYWPTQAGGGIYNPGDSAGSMLSNMILTSIVVYDLDTEPIGSPRGKLLPFVNVQYNTVTVSNPDDYFYDYKYLDVKVVDKNNTPISGATVDITNITNPVYPSINMNRDVKTSFITKSDGHIPLPSDTLNTAVILNNLKNSVSNVNMSHMVKATFYGISNTVTVIPDSTWYRPTPDLYQNTIVIQLAVDTLLGSILGKITDIDNIPIAGASIMNSDGSSTISDIYGNYSISNLYPGSYTLTVSAIGYITQSYDYNIISNETITKNFVLEVCLKPICDISVTTL